MTTTGTTGGTTTRTTVGPRVLVGVNVIWFGLSLVFDGVNSLLLPSRVAEAAPEAEATIVGVVTFAGIVIGLSVQPLFGSFGDAARPRHGRLRPVVLAGGATALLLIPLGASANLVVIAVAYGLVMVASNAFQAFGQPLLPELVEPARRGRASGVKGFMDLAGATAGFVLLGSLIEQAGATVAATAASGVVVATLVLLRLLVREPPARDRRAPTPVRRPLRVVRREHPAFVRAVAARFLFLVGTYAVGRFFLFFVADRLGVSPGDAADDAGYLLGGLALVTAVGALAAGWLVDRWGRRRVMAAGAVVNAAGILLLMLARDATGIFAFGSVMAVGSAAFGAANWALVADLAPADAAGRFLGLANVGTAGAAAAAGLLGPLVDVGGGALGFPLLLGAAAAASLASLIPMRRLPDAVGPRDLAEAIPARGRWRA